MARRVLASKVVRMSELYWFAMHGEVAKVGRLIAARADVDAGGTVVSIARRPPRRRPTRRPAPPPFSVAGGLGTARARFFREGR